MVLMSQGLDIGAAQPHSVTLERHTQRVYMRSSSPCGKVTK